MTGDVIVGIDPGANGALAAVEEKRDGGGCALFYPVLYNVENFIAVLKDLRIHHWNVYACVENVHAMPKQGVSSMFTFGKNFGIILGILNALRIPYYLVEPRVWTRYWNLTSDKSGHIARANELFDMQLKRTPRCKKQHDGMADALLIAEYGRRNLSTLQEKSGK